MRRMLALIVLLVAWPATAGESWTLAVLPDTQLYSASFPEHFAQQTRWLADHARELNLRFVAHMGDVTCHNNADEWANARAAMGALDGVAPYGIVLGNHDYGPDGRSEERTTLASRYFTTWELLAAPQTGGVMDPTSIENSYHLFEAGGQRWIVVCLEYAPRTWAVAWANRVLSEHADRRAIVVTHAYLHNSGQRQDITKDPKQSGNPHRYGFEKLPGGLMDGEQIWNALIRGHANVCLVLSGHIAGVARLTSTNDAGAPVHQILSDFQAEPEGGNGWLRLLTFAADGQSLQVRTWSPKLGQGRDNALNAFTLDLSRLAKLPPAPSRRAARTARSLW